MKMILVFCLLLVSSKLFAQDDSITLAIVNEGKKIYRSEMASWFGTDVFLEKFEDQRSNIAGYFSYGENDSTSCIFFSKGDEPTILARISFDSTFSVQRARVSQEPVHFTAYEKEIYNIRQVALAAIRTDTLFKIYPNTRLNLVPILDGENKKVYVLTGPTTSGVVIFGNDYVLKFNGNNTLIEKKALHQNIIPVEYGKDPADKVAVATIHSHAEETGAYITPTDIATLLLYGNATKWETHYVMSKEYVSVWDIRKKNLTVISREVWEKVQNDHPGNRRKKKGRRA